MHTPILPHPYISGGSRVFRWPVPPYFYPSNPLLNPGPLECP